MGACPEPKLSQPPVPDTPFLLSHALHTHATAARPVFAHGDPDPGLGLRGPGPPAGMAALAARRAHCARAAGDPVRARRLERADRTAPAGRPPRDDRERRVARP